MTPFSPFVGPIQRDETGEWSAALLFEGEPRGQVTLELDPDVETAWAAQVGKVFVERLQNEAALRVEICTGMLELAQEWFEDDEQPDQLLSLEKFISLIRLSSVTLHEDATSSWWYEDGDVFAGHYIVASLYAAGRLGEIQTQG